MKNSTPQVFGSRHFKKLVQKTLKILPEGVVNYVFENVTFVGSFDDSLAYTLQSGDLKGKYLIILSDELLNEDGGQIIKTIVHEIGHAVSGHKNAIRQPQSRQEIKNQEDEANEFVRRIVNV